MIRSELEIAKMEPLLLQSIAGIVAKNVLTYAIKCESKVILLSFLFYRADSIRRSQVIRPYTLSAVSLSSVRFN